MVRPKSKQRRFPRKVLRNWWTAAFGIISSFFFIFLWLILALAQAPGPEPVGKGLVGFISLFFPLVWWFLLKASYFTNIQIEGGYVVVRNFFDKSIIPAGQISDVTWEGGVDIITKDGRKYWCLNLGGSLIGALAGYPTNRRCARNIKTFLEEYRSKGSENTDEPISRGIHLNLIFLATAVLVSYSALRFLEFAL